MQTVIKVRYEMLHQEEDAFGTVLTIVNSNQFSRIVPFYASLKH